MTKAKDFAVLVITYNAANYIAGCLKSLQKLNQELFDCLVVDNSSNDGTRELAKGAWPGVEVVNTGANLGYSGAYNYIHHFLEKQDRRYRYYFIVNNDVEFVSLDLFDRAEKILADSRIGLLSPTILNADRTIQNQGGRFLFWTGTPLANRSGEAYRPKAGLVSSHWTSGCAFFIRQADFAKVQGFEDYFMFMEDVSLSWKMLLAGRLLVTDLGSALIHFGSGSAKSSTFEHFYVERNRLYLYYQHLSPWGFVIDLPILILARLLLLARQPQLAVVGAKLRGLFRGLITMTRLPKRSRSFKGDWTLIRAFNQPPHEL